MFAVATGFFDARETVMTKRTLLALVSASLALAWGCGGPSEPPKPGPGVVAPKPPAGKPVPTTDDTEDLGTKPAEVPVKGPAGPYPAKAAEEVREGLAKISRLPEHTVKALVKTPADLKAKGLLAKAELENVPNDAAIVLAMNGWVAPDKWRASRGEAKGVLEALEALQKVEADPARADKAELVAKAKAALKTADVSEADLKMVHRYQKDLAEAFALK
jgi:hypothetical protein